MKTAIRTVLFLLAPLFLAAQGAAGSSLELGYAKTGIAFGNAPKWNGLRFNLSDCEIERIHGVNVTFWKPAEVSGDHATGTIAGLSLGLVGVSAGRVAGISVGGVGIGAGRIDGIAVGGLGVGAGWVRGIAIGALGIGATSIRGIGIGGLGVGAEDVRGLAVGGVGLGGNELIGICVGGVGIGGDRLRGVMIGPIGVGGEVGSGIALAGAYNRFERFQGLGAGAFCRMTERLTGVTIGIVNYAHSLNGVQIGLLNYAGNNPRGLRVLPGVNVHF